MAKDTKKFAVIRTGGKQYRVSEGEVLTIEKIEAKDKEVINPEVLLVADGEKLEIGTPLVSKATVKASVLGQEKADKIVVFKYKPKKNYRVKKGHRQQITRIKIDSISF